MYGRGMADALRAQTGENGEGMGERICAEIVEETGKGRGYAKRVLRGSCDEMNCQTRSMEEGNSVLHIGKKGPSYRGEKHRGITRE